MNKTAAGSAFLGCSAVLALLLSARMISPLLSGVIFAVALVAFGIMSRGFTGRKWRKSML